MRLRTWLLAATCSLVLATSGCAGGARFLSLAPAAETGGVVVSGAATVRAGDAAHYTATNHGQAIRSGDVTWLVNGIPGGNAALGKITADGSYSAPDDVPTDPQIVIGAMYAGESGALPVELWNPVPVIYSVAARDLGSVLEIEVSGKNFVTGATLRLDGGAYVAKSVTSEKLLATLPAGASQSSLATVAVVNPPPGENVSADVALAVTRPVRPARNPVRGTPALPATPYDYVKYAITDLPAHFTNGAPGSPADTDNTPPDNPITIAGATLGRVLFYDRKLSLNNLVSCSSCHQQGRGFADPARLSIGFRGGMTGRHSMGLSNARFYARGRFFWDERAATLEAQALQPIQDAAEMGMTLDALELKLAATDYYPALFQAAFGSPEVTRDRIAKAIAQFVRAMVSYQSKYDSAFVNGNPNFAAVFTPQELHGFQLFGPNVGGQGVSARCDRCHGTTAHVSGVLQNNGLDAVTVDQGAGQGRFKSPSLRNIGQRQRFMHDGRFTTLEEVVQFYNTGVQNNPNLSNLLRNQDGTVTRLNLSAQDMADMVAFLRTLTDNNFLSDPRFSDPFQ